MINNCITCKLKVAIIAAFSLIFSNHVIGQTNVFISAMPRTNHATNFSGISPPVIRYQRMPISMNYTFGIEHYIKPKFAVELGLMRNSSKLIEKSYFGSNFNDHRFSGYGTTRDWSFTWQIFISFKKIVYNYNNFNFYVNAGANLNLQNPWSGLQINFERTYKDVITGGDSTILINKLYSKHREYIPISMQAQLGVSKTFRNRLTATVSAVGYYSTPIYDIFHTINYQSNIYENRFVQLGSFVALNFQLSYPIIQKKWPKVF